MRWWWQKAPDRTEAKEHLQKLMDRDPEVKALSRQLRAQQSRNHFSEMVQAAIARTAGEGH